MRGWTKLPCKQLSTPALPVAHLVLAQKKRKTKPFVSPGFCSSQNKTKRFTMFWSWPKKPNQTKLKQKSCWAARLQLPADRLRILGQETGRVIPGSLRCCQQGRDHAATVLLLQCTQLCGGTFLFLPVAREQPQNKNQEGAAFGVWWLSMTIW